jgi:uncharacterized protein
MAEEPVVALHGPRAVGKTTLLRSLAGAHGAEVIDLDDLATREAVTVDPRPATAPCRWRHRP